MEGARVAPREEEEELACLSEVLCQPVRAKVVRGCDDLDLVMSCALATVYHEVEDIVAVRVALRQGDSVIENKDVAWFIILEL